MTGLFLHRFHTEARVRKHRSTAVPRIMEPDVRQIVSPDHIRSQGFSEKDSFNLF